MWSVAKINKILESKKYIQLCEKRLCTLDKKEFYLNAFEFGVFSTKELCSRLSHAMHTLGFISTDMLTPFITSLATVSGFAEQYRELATIYWTKATMLGILKRPDAYQILNCRSTVTGYEFALTDRELSTKVGEVIFEHHIQINAVVSYPVFRTSSPGNIKRLFRL